MQEERLKELLSKVAAGEIRIEDALADLKHMPFEDLGFAKIDHHRQLRQGMPEVIYAPGKTAKQIVAIASKLKSHNDVVLATRVHAEQALEAREFDRSAQYFDEARMLVWGSIPGASEDSSDIEPDNHVLVITAGTADLPVAREAELVLKACKIPVRLLSDVGVAGIHRVAQKIELLRRARVCIVVAGMDGVLPSVIGGLVQNPVIACPTSTGYGASFQGLAPLLTMLNSCAAGVTVVNIDNGFGAAIAAVKILRS